MASIKISFTILSAPTLSFALSTRGIILSLSPSKSSFAIFSSSLNASNSSSVLVSSTLLSEKCSINLNSELSSGVIATLHILHILLSHSLRSGNLYVFTILLLTDVHFQAF